MSFPLRAYQQEGVEALRASYASGRRAPLYVLPTGGGKTRVFSEIATLAVAKSHSTIILVHRQELLLQASRALSLLGVQHGLMSPAYAQSNHQVQIASVQTLVRRLGRVQAPNLIIVDEAHHGVSPTYRKIFNAFPKARILGVTATPIRTNGEGLSEIFDDLILGPSISELIQLGFLVPPTVYAPPVGIDLTGVRKVRGDFDRGELQSRLGKPSITGCAIEHYTRLAKGEPFIAFTASVQLAEQTARQFSEAGFPTVRMDGTMEDRARRQALDDLGAGRICGLTSADLIGEGVDVPRCSVAILLRPTYSTALYLQQVGRALRPYPGKTRALVLDHVGNTLRHGFPDDDREWSLDGTKRNKRMADEPSVRVTQCPKCFFVFLAGPEKCPQCQHQAPPRQRTIAEKEGELAELKREEVARARAARREEGQADTLEKLQAIARKRGYSSGWAYHRWQARHKKRARA